MSKYPLHSSKFLEDHRTERRRKEEGMSLIGGLKAPQNDLIME